MPANHCIPHTEAAKAKMRLARLGKPAPWRERPRRIVEGVALYRCGRCRDFLSRDAFYESRRNTLGITSDCKSCHCAVNVSSRDKANSRRIGRLSEANRRARLAGSPGRLTASMLGKLALILGRACLNCASAVEMQWDHIVPLARGGANRPGNLQPLCRKCNERKQARTIDYRTDEQKAAVVIEFKRLAESVKVADHV